MRPNPLIDVWRDGGYTLNGWMHIPSSWAAETMAHAGWDSVALLDCQQMAVQGDLARCIRLLAHVWLPAEQTPCHAYLGEASRLRPDRSGHN